MYVAYAEDVPGDGTCLFHSIALPLKTTGGALRELVCQYIEDHAAQPMHGTAIADWIRWEMEMSPAQYVSKMRRGGWGGALEMTLLSSLLRTPIFVYAPRGAKCVQITEVRPDTTLPSVGQKVPFICVLYVNNCHFMHLRIK